MTAAATATGAAPCTDCVALAAQLKEVRAELRGVEEDLQRERRRCDRLDDDVEDLRKRLTAAEGKQSTTDALGDVVCPRCKLACRDAGPGCPDCWDRRQVYAEAL